MLGWRSWISHIPHKNEDAGSNPVPSTLYISEVIVSVEPTTIEQIPTKGSLWLHEKSANKYRVITITNLHATDKRYPVTVVYKGHDGKLWSRPLSEWSNSMILVKEHFVVKCIRQFLLDQID